MRPFALPILLAACVSASVRTPEPPRPLVVLVHGRGQAGADSALMRNEWKRDLDSALASQGFPALRPQDVRLAWYADVMDPGVDAACDRSYTVEAGLGDIARGFLVSLASVMPDSGREEDRQVRALIGDVLYLVDQQTRCATETRLGNVLASARAERRPVILVAYSLGAAVSYSHLARLRDSTSRVQLITLGAPIGVPIARELLLGGNGLRVPASVARWVNIYDPDDALAGPLDLRSAAVQDRRVRTTVRGDAHHASRYLRDDETGAALGEALCSATANAWAARCAELHRDR
jgi:hypothetical protein